MHGVYIRYRNLKRTVRDEAAIDIQRAFRGMQVRLEIHLNNKSIPSSQKSNNTNTNNLLLSSNEKIHSKKAHLHGLQNSPSGEQIHRHKLSKKQSNYDANHSNSSSTSSSASTSPTDSDLTNNNNNNIHKSTSLGSVASLITNSSNSNNNNASVLLSSTDLEIGNGAIITNTNSSHQPRKRKGVEITRSLIQPSGSGSSGGGSGSHNSDLYIEWLNSSQNATSMRNKYIDLHQKKHHLKNILKRFDEEFTITHGRMPTRKEKEVSK